MVALAPAVRPSQNACYTAARPSALLVRMRARISQTAWISRTFMVSDGSAQQRRRREGRHEDVGRLVQERVPAAQRQPELADRCRRAAACACRTDATHHGAHGRWMGSRDNSLVPVTPSLRTPPRRGLRGGPRMEWASAGRSFGAGARALARLAPSRVLGPSSSSSLRAGLRHVPTQCRGSVGARTRRCHCHVLSRVVHRDSSPDVVYVGHCGLPSSSVGQRCWCMSAVLAADPTFR